jgi:hypothetical protein
MNSFYYINTETDELLGFTTCRYKALSFTGLIFNLGTIFFSRAHFSLSPKYAARADPKLSEPTTRSVLILGKDLELIHAITDLRSVLRGKSFNEILQY